MSLTFRQGTAYAACRRLAREGLPGGWFSRATLAARMGLTEQVVGGYLGALVRAGHVERKPDGAWWRLTEQGRAGL